jgi:hypothetical protein
MVRRWPTGYGALILHGIAMAAHPDETIRATAFAALNSIVGIYGQPLSWGEISQGFNLGGEKILFATRARGIFKPAVMQRGVLSIKTTVPRVGRGARYADIHDDSGSFIYRPGASPLRCVLSRFAAS